MLVVKLSVIIVNIIVILILIVGAAQMYDTAILAWVFFDIILLVVNTILIVTQFVNIGIKK